MFIAAGKHHTQRVAGQWVVRRQLERFRGDFNRFPQTTGCGIGTSQLRHVIHTHWIQPHRRTQVPNRRPKLLLIKRSHPRHELHTRMIRRQGQQTLR